MYVVTKIGVNTFSSPFGKDILKNLDTPNRLQTEAAKDASGRNEKVETRSCLVRCALTPCSLRWCRWPTAILVQTTGGQLVVTIIIKLDYMLLMTIFPKNEF